MIYSLHTKRIYLTAISDYYEEDIIIVIIIIILLMMGSDDVENDYNPLHDV